MSRHHGRKCPWSSCLQWWTVPKDQATTRVLCSGTTHTSWQIRSASKCRYGFPGARICAGFFWWFTSTMAGWSAQSIGKWWTRRQWWYITVCLQCERWNQSWILPTVTSVFRDTAHTPAMIKHGMDVIRDATLHVNPGQVPAMTVDQPLYAIAKQIQ